ncbi:hypothetical protein XELAEV_18021628mg [Xenopus laevis]|uniref:Uncharacterized protein n=1 Tax=Xenopus laevis TaxID=8355 RepID=A0A974DAT3_XENLA|nr:hypothetical protein XELAEV_18021628mg [Xenopus laevis]
MNRRGFVTEIFIYNKKNTECSTYKPYVQGTHTEMRQSVTFPPSPLFIHISIELLYKLLYNKTPVSCTYRTY